MQLYILGAGEFSCCVSELASATGNYNAVHFLDDDRSKEGVVGSICECAQFVNEDSEFIVAIGNGEVRMRLLDTLKEMRATVATLVHPRAYVSETAELQAGTIVMPMAVVNSNTIVGRGCIVDCSTVVDHNCCIGEGIHIKPGAVVRPGNTLKAGTAVSTGEVIEARTRRGN